MYLISVGDSLGYHKRHSGASPVLTVERDAEFQFGGGGNEEVVFSTPKSADSLSTTPGPEFPHPERGDCLPGLSRPR